MAKEDKREKGEKKLEDKKSKKERAKSSEVQPITAECLLRKVIKDKKKKRVYTVEEVQNAYDSTRKSKSDFPRYVASIYPDKVTFSATKKGKKPKSIEYKNISQIIPTPEDPQSFLIHVPKCRKVKPFTALLTWLDPQSSTTFEKAVRGVSDAPFAVPREDNEKSGSNTDCYRSSKGDDADLKNPPLLQKSQAQYFSNSLSTSESDANYSSHDIIRISKGVSETYTHFSPRRARSQQVGKGLGGRSSTSSDSYSSSDASCDQHSDDSDYICRDKNSVFYGERMSPKSQYIDRLLRATVQMQNKADWP